MTKHLVVFLTSFIAFWVFVTPLTANSTEPSSNAETGSGCMLPAPNSVSVLSIQPTDVDLQWTGVLGAASYEISMYDVTASSWLLPQYTSLTTHNFAGLTPGHNYIVGVAASACLTGPYGPSSESGFTAPIIIVDELVQNSCTFPQGNGTMSNSFFVYLIPATTNGVSMEVTRIKVSHGDNEVDPVMFKMWADCHNDIHYQFESMPASVSQTPLSGQTQSVDFNFPNPFPPNPPINYFIIRNPVLTASGFVRATIDIDGFPRGILRSCNFTEPNRCTGIDVRAAGPGGDPEPEFIEGGLKPEREVLVTTPELPSFSVSPNPFSGIFQVQYQLPAASRVSLTLTDLNGKVIQTVNPEVVFPAGEHVTSFQDESLPAGMYFLVLQTDQGRITTTLVKQR